MRDGLDFRNKEEDSLHMSCYVGSAERKEEDSLLYNAMEGQTVKSYASNKPLSTIIEQPNRETSTLGSFCHGPNAPMMGNNHQH